MAADGSVVVVGGTRAIGLEIVEHYAAEGREVVLTGQTPENVDAAVAAVRPERRPGPRPHVRPRPAPQDRRLPCGRRARRAPGARRDRSRPQHRRRLPPRPRDPARDAQARRVHGSGQRAPRPAVASLVGRAVRRHGEGAAVPGLDHRHDRQRRRRRADPDARRGAQAHPGQLDPPGRRRRQPVLGGEAGRDRQVHLGDADRAALHAWTRSSTRWCSCSRTRPSTGST